MSEINEIPVTEVADDAVLLDVRQPNEYAAGHAPGAVSIPLGELRGRLGELPAERPLSVICKTGGRSMMAAQFLAAEGVQVINVAGGTTAWAEAGKPLVSETGEEPAVVAPSTPPTGP